MALKRDAYTLHIRLDNINPADAIALMKMFKFMEYLGNIGSSRFCSFFADGDGSFRPKVSFVYPIELPEVPEIDGIVKYVKETDEIKGHLEGQPISSAGDFAIDSDAIAWRIYHDPEPEGYVRPPHPQEEAKKISPK
jgi:hypothetical protein